jgi:tripartite-type tricarboxylate transporter receptor subunit TctC
MKANSLFPATLCMLAAMSCAIATAQSPSYPVKPIRLIVPYPPGGPTDLIGRAVNESLAKRLGQPVIVDNRGGAASVIGAEITARAPADGYTLLVATVTTLAVNPALNSRLPYDPERDFAPVSMLGSTPYLLAVHPQLPARSVPQLIAYAKASPGKLSFGSAGSGSSAHLAGELLKHMAAIDIVHIPYKGSGPAIVDLIAGQIALMFSGISVLKPHVDGGRLRPLAVSTIKRSMSAPDIPTLDESGVKGYQTKSWNALVAPRGMPATIIQRLNRELHAVLNTPAVADRIKQQGIEPEPGTPEELAGYVREEILRFRNLITAVGLKLE